MSSNINPNNIDGAYPVAGQDNNSQGFRDNFTNIKTNFGYAAAEINDLQSKVVLKAALTGSTLNNDMLGAVLSNAQLQDMGYTRVALGTLSGSVGINYAAGPFQTVSTNGAISLSFTNWPVAGIAGVVTVQITVTNTGHTVTFPTAVSVNTLGIQGLNTSTNVMTFATTGVYTFQFVTYDAGATVTINEFNNQLNPFNYSEQILANSGAASLSTTTSYFTTTTAETAILAVGVPGQIKTLAMYGNAGDMVITVANAGWKTSGTGTITFNNIGNACTLQYINAKWFCIGNNGCVFG
jgi:hypothetical protein